MGSSKSKINSEYGDMAITFDNWNYSPGQQVNGSVLVNLKMDFPANKLVLSGGNYEKIQYWDYSDKGAEMTKKKLEYNDWKFLVGDWAGDWIPKGQNQFPFSFTLPTDCPNTFYYSFDEHKNHPVKGIVQYKIVALLESPAEAQDKKRLRCSDYVFVSKPVNISTNKVTSTKVQEKNVQVVQCCVNKGDIYMKNWFENEIRSIGDELNIVSEIRNSSKMVIQRYRANFNQIMSIRKSPERNPKIYVHNLSSVLANREIPAGGDFTDLNSLNFALPMQYQKEIAGVDDRIYRNVTTNGKLVQCAYFAETEALMEGSCVRKGLCNSIEVTLADRGKISPQPRYGMEDYPEDWRPNVRQVQIIDTRNF